MMMRDSREGSLSIQSMIGILAIQSLAFLALANAAEPPRGEPEAYILADDLMAEAEMAAAEGNFDALLAPQLNRRATAKELKTFDERSIQIVVHKSTKLRGEQFLQVFEMNDAGGFNLVYDFPISTAKERWVTGKSGRRYYAYTPEGQFVVDSFQRNRWSTLWQVNLEFVLPFSGGVLIHATSPDHYHELGQPASGGCVRLHRDNAKLLWELVTQYELSDIGITVISADEEPAAEVPAQPVN